ncbi:glycosyltransferase family 2 protein [Spirosoma pollinicola]|uniref:Glycosyltransferase n=1 Tax=Spirosoma pollinicola TaxID=2057025 RepID=A0A2K8Z5C4_9BACT|nr:glycosyltransferase family 2 protein [Spirosoma pollinicola]AUD05061.1 glycosyltransferase [Spirosoma pollinicola]
MQLAKETSKPLISIIVPVFNAVICLEAALESIVNQNYSNYELIIIDGGSTDGSLTVIEKFKDKIKLCISEVDSGIYDAMNKGIDRAEGEWLYFLGSDDELSPDILEKIVPFLNDKYKIVFGDVVFDNGYRMQSFLGYRTLLQNTLHHQGAFYSRENFTSFRYDNSLKILADYELNLINYVKKLPVLHIPAIIARCNSGGTSSQLSQSLFETNMVRKRHVDGKLKNLLLTLSLNLYYTQKMIRRVLYGHKV